MFLQNSTIEKKQVKLIIQNCFPNRWIDLPLISNVQSLWIITAAIIDFLSDFIPIDGARLVCDMQNLDNHTHYY